MACQALITGATGGMNTEDSAEGWASTPTYRACGEGPTGKTVRDVEGESEEQRSEAGDTREGVPLAGKEPTK